MSAVTDKQLTPDISQNDSRRAIVVVGAGPVGIHVAREIATRLQSTINPPRVVVFGTEQRNPYNRVHLSSFLAGDIEPSSFHDDVTDLSDKQVDLRFGYTIEKIDRGEQVVIDQNGDQTPYSALILATGSRPRWLNIPGVEKDGVFTFRDLDDAEKLAARRLRTRNTVIIGGGLLGLETARAMRRFNTNITVVEHSPRLMFNQLDDPGGARLLAEVEASGIRVITRGNVIAVLGDLSVEAVELSDEQIIECDTLIIAAGIKPNVELAVQSGLSFGRGITVNAQMRTSDPNIYAVGECAEIDDVVYGLVAPGIEQGTVAACVVTGEFAEFRNGATSATLKVLSTPVFSAGEITNSALPLQAYRFEGEASDGAKFYRLLNLDRGRLVGAVAVGEWAEMPHIKQLLSKRAYIWPWQRYRFATQGNLTSEGRSASVADWPSDSTVCSCLNVTRGQIGQAVLNGTNSVDAIALQTRASTVCGSCKPLLAEILGGSAKLEPTPKFKLIAAMSVFCLLGCLWAWGLPGWPYANSVQAAPNWNWLWTESLYKQISGFTLLGLALFATLLSARKRLPDITWLNYTTWRFIHIGIGVVLLGSLLVHTGFRLGAGLNFLLMACFLTIAITGAVGGMVVAGEHRLEPSSAKLVRKLSVWSHILVLWPLPVLLGFHIFKTYYF